jgi:hypothetical protein
MGKTYKTAQGKILDLEKLKLQNELTPAVGNMRVNARGDQLGPGGKVVKSREEMLDQHYQNNVNKRRKAAGQDVIPTRAGKVEEKKKFEPGGIEVDSIDTSSKDPISLDDDFVDPEYTDIDYNNPVASNRNNTYEFTGDTEETVDLGSPGKIDSVTGIGEGSKALKGGLARAVAKTREYEDKKNKPKRI